MKIFKALKRRHRFLLILIAVLLFLIIGACAPFVRYKPLSSITAQNLKTTNYCQDQSGTERVMLLETNTSAWEERMRMMQVAEKEIILFYL